ncbi:MAG: hypothetical protein HRU38_07465 [Saccharospirillaceae bacterium]|nr:hypothetical protein [Pseudomonadales bacterium]NRB78490.1 hypothetical protein [Saccharospirillaceae bacterium]
MKKILTALTVLCLSSCNAIDYKNQMGSVEIQVEKAEVLAVYQANLTDFYQVMHEGLSELSLSGFVALKDTFADETLLVCAEDEACKVDAYEQHFRQLHSYIYENDLANVEGIYIESNSSDQHLIVVYGFYAFVGVDHQRLAVFIDEMSVSRNIDNNPYGIERVQSIDAILYRHNLGKSAEFEAIGVHPIGKIIRIKKPLELKSLYYSVDISDIEFTDYAIGVSVHLVGHEYEISTATKVDDIRTGPVEVKEASTLY